MVDRLMRMASLGELGRAWDTESFPSAGFAIFSVADDIDEASVVGGMVEGYCCPAIRFSATRARASRESVGDRLPGCWVLRVEGRVPSNASAVGKLMLLRSKG